MLSNFVRYIAPLVHFSLVILVFESSLWSRNIFLASYGKADMTDSPQPLPKERGAYFVSVCPIGLNVCVCLTVNNISITTW